MPNIFFFHDKNKIKRKSAPGYVPSTSFSEGVQSTFQPPVYQDNISQIKVYLGVAPARVGKHEHGEVRRANTTRMVDLISSYLIERLRLQTWSKSDFSNVETRCTYIHTRPHACPTVIIVIILWL